MDPVGKPGRLNRPSSRIRRQRSHEWKDYGSSSDNDEDKQTYRYEDPSRNTQDARKGDNGKISYFKIIEMEKFLRSEGPFLRN